jgi:glycerol-3-phosphate acyltransferase PlsY
MAFHRDIAILTLLYLIIGDGLAAIIGRRYGRRKIFDKSLEGSLAFAGSCVLVSLFFPAVPFWIRLSGVFIATVSELVPMRASDNLRVPIISGSIMEILFISYLRQRSDMPSGDHLIVIVQAMGQFVLS